MKRVIVIGGGIAGLSTARALADEYLVTLIYDSFPVQSSHLHVLMQAGADTMVELFPELQETILNQTPVVDWSIETRWENESGRFPQIKQGPRCHLFSRHYLNSLLTEALARHPAVTIIHDRIRGYEENQVTLSNGTQLKTDYLVLAGGKHFPLKKEFQLSLDEYPVDLTYHSYFYRLQDLNLRDYKQYYFQPDPELSPVGGVISPVENSQCIVTLISYEKKLSRCQNQRDFLNLARKIPRQDFYQIIKDAGPISELQIFRRQTSHRLNFDQAKLPPSVIVVGDLLTSHNPAFGQGMSLAFLQAKLLREHLRKPQFSNQVFHQKAAEMSFPALRLSLLSPLLLRLATRLCQRSPLLHGKFLRYLHGACL